MDSPTISVMIPSLNQGRFIQQAIESVLDQKYPNLELMVFDAGSTDETISILRKFEKHFTFWVSQPDRGQSDAINQAWSRATGQILAWMNADDFYEPGAFSIVADHFQKRPNCRLFSGAMSIIDEEGKFLRVKKPSPVTVEHLLPWGTVPGQPATFLHVEVFHNAGKLREDLHYVVDWEYWLRIALNFPASAICSTDSVLAAAREWKQSKTCSAAGKDAAEVRRVLEELFAGDKVPAHLRSWKSRAFAQSWWRQAESECLVGKRTEASASLKKALALAPFGFSPSKILRLWMRIRRTGN